MPKPELFFACSNLKDEYLTQLGKEMNGILRILYGFREKGVISVDHPPIDVNAQILFDWLNNYNATTKPLDLFHYSGHADGHHFTTIEGKYSETALVDLFSGLKPKLVFLNGCSTKGFVGRLLANGVGAVIATSVSVKDSLAAQFAINFYDAFSKKQTLRDAFRKARTVQSGSTNDSTTGIWNAMEEHSDSREGYRSWGNLQPKDRTAAWGLYYTPNEADYNETGEPCSILDWQLVTVDGPNLGLPPRVNALNKEIDDLWNSPKRQEIEEVIKDAQMFLDVDGLPDELKPAAQRQLDAAQKRKLEEIIMPLRQKQDELYNILREPALKARRAMIAEDIKELRFQDQEDFLGKKNLGKNDLSALLLQGGPRCALKLLQERIVHEIQLPVGTDSCRLDVFDLSSNIYSAEELFGQISNRFPSARAVADVISEIEAVFVNGIDYVLVFNNFSKTIGKAQLTLLKKFWKGIVERHKQPTMPISSAGKKGRVMLFVLDKNCLLVDQNGKQVSNNEQDYVTNFAEEESFAYVLPIVKCVGKSIVEPWISQRFVLYNRDNFSFNKFEEPHFMLDAIQTVCSELEINVFGEKLDIYDNEFAKYAYPGVLEILPNYRTLTDQEIDDNL